MQSEISHQSAVPGESSAHDLRRHASLSAVHVMALFILAAGACGVVGWIGDITVLAQPSSSLAPMSLVTALLFCLVAADLVCRSRAGGTSLPWISFPIGLLVCAAGLWTLWSYGFGGTLPFDSWLSGSRIMGGMNNGLNRMSPVSAICFALYGAAACVGVPVRPRGGIVIQVLAGAGILFALLSLVGYLYTITSLVALSDYKPIAPQTALAFFSAFLGFFLSSPDRGVMATILSDELGGILARRLLVFVLVLPLLLGGIASAALRVGVLTGPTSIFFLTASTVLSFACLLLFNAFAINSSEKGRRGAQKSLKESERAYRSLFENAADPMFLVSRDLVVQEANEAAAVCLGREAVMMRGRLLSDLSFACVQDLGSRLERAFAGGEAAFEVCARAADGRDVPLEMRARDVEFRGAPAALIIARDLSERRRSDRVLAEKEALLQQAQKMEAIGRLAGGVAHDFNNLLTVIMGYSELLLDKLGPGHAARVDAGEIKTCAARATALTRQLLAFSRRQPNAPRSTDLRAVVRELTPLLARLIGEKISLEVRLDGPQSCIRIDPNQLEQIVINLAVNARDAMPGGGTLTIETSECRDGAAPAAPDGSAVELTVRDTGSGIPDDVLPHIFEPFFTTKLAGHGTGLGLSTVYGIVTQNNGTISVSSSAAGTTMRIRFPRVAEAADVAWQANETPPCAEPASAVLLVEDDPSVRRYLAAGLRREGYAVFEAASGEEALVVADSSGRAIDMVVSDVVMPGMGGKQLADEMIRRLPLAHILFMSGYAGTAEDEMGSLCGGFDLIEKPFSAASLVERIRKLAASPGSPSAAARTDTECGHSAVSLYTTPTGGNTC
jgi:two-component system, cell cycle sensor histidine kinase and response regulator CckA